jgi:hypothetical protein
MVFREAGMSVSRAARSHGDSSSHSPPEAPAGCWAASGGRLQLCGVVYAGSSRPCLNPRGRDSVPACRGAPMRSLPIVRPFLLSGLLAVASCGSDTHGMPVLAAENERGLNLMRARRPALSS